MRAPVKTTDNKVRQNSNNCLLTGKQKATSELLHLLWVIKQKFSEKMHRG